MMRRWTWLKCGVLALMLMSVLWLVYGAGADLSRLAPARIREMILSFGLLAPLIYLLGYGQPIVPLPASVVIAGAGLAFGPMWGTVLALAGSTLRASTQFVMARWLGRDTISRLLKGRAASFDHQLRVRSFQAVLWTRLIPNLPFDLQNYGFGVSGVRFGPYVAASALGLLPITVVLVCVGASLTEFRSLWTLLALLIAVAGAVVAVRLGWRRRSGMRLTRRPNPLR